jgi:glutaminase
MLGELCTRIAEEGKWLFFSDCEHLYRFRRHLHSLQLGHGHPVPGWLDFNDTDHAVEWCENRLIAEADLGEEHLQASCDLSQQYLCQGMTPAELESVKHSGSERPYPAGEVIVRSGDPGDCLFFILSGEVEVTVDTDDGNPLRLTTLGPGTVFGEIALVNRQRRTADVMATRDTVCLQVCFDTLSADIRTKMLINMASYFAGKIEHATQLMQHLG